MRVFAVNAGSATLKAALYQIEGGKTERLNHFHVRFQPDSISVTGQYLTDGWVKMPEQWQDRYLAALGFLLDQVGDAPDVVVHRVVHGGPDFSDHQVIDDKVLAGLKALVPFAPLHQPYNLALIEACAQLRPRIKQVACFDTVFHTSLPLVAKRYALPRDCYDRGERVYGYHGLSYEYITRKFAELQPEAANSRLLIAHLGSGASLCGVIDGKSQATSMGFSTFEGVPMSTRPGHIDPGLIVYWLQQGWRLADVEQMLYKRSGLLGLSGISGDYQQLDQSSAVEAKEAIEAFIYQVNRACGAIVAQLGGVDHVIFTAGIGEHSAGLRSRLTALLGGWLPLELDEAANENAELCISAIESKVKCWVLPTNEEAMMVAHAWRLLT